jgi:hypothetical protein
LAAAVAAAAVWCQHAERAVLCVLGRAGFFFLDRGDYG